MLTSSIGDLKEENKKYRETHHQTSYKGGDKTLQLFSAFQVFFSLTGIKKGIKEEHQFVQSFFIPIFFNHLNHKNNNIEVFFPDNSAQSERTNRLINKDNEKKSKKW